VGFAAKQNPAINTKMSVYKPFMSGRNVIRFFEQKREIF